MFERWPKRPRAGGKSKITHKSQITGAQDEDEDEDEAGLSTQIHMQIWLHVEKKKKNHIRHWKLSFKINGYIMLLKKLFIVKVADTINL